jgi:signal transduction histidine kinase
MVALQNSQLFSHLPVEELQALRQVCQEKHFSKSAEIFKEGDDGDGVYLVKEGLVQVSGIIGDNVRHVFAKIGPGEVFGEMAVLENKPRSATASAGVDTVVYFIPRGVMLAMVERSPQLSMKLLREISARLREFNRQYVREVLQAERLSVVGKFARSIIHDLKNPLNIISLSAEIANMENTPADRRKDANIYIRRQVDRINDMINEILEFTQGAAAVLVLSGTDYAEFVKEVMEELRLELEMKSVIIEFANSPPAVKPMLNPKRLRHLFHNLINNAVQIMPKGGKIILQFKLTATEVITEIRDTGPGIAPEIASRLFEPFATFGKAQGTGLGLSICKKIIEDHRGKISAHNAPGGGAVFAFTLPLPKKA